ncbi:hypothetical protein TNCV_3808371 [Trichonephila clavipes]|nr:hypothetical protein TNCV_3808371 [Trichonephila clavipes]
MIFWEYTSTGIAWLQTRPAFSAALSEWMATTCSNALDSMNTRLSNGVTENIRVPPLQRKVLGHNPKYVLGVNPALCPLESLDPHNAGLCGCTLRYCD